ncbi:MAG: hypothetical protein IT162_22160 [Bryobacterales bacterium]|nr:hypothetical protein [Bryobacterales bacterium]
MAAGANAPTAKAPAAPAAAAAAAPKVSAQPMFQRFVHPEARALAGLDLKRLLTSPLGKMLGAQIEGTGWKQKASAQGLDFAADVERVIVSSPGDASGKQAALSEEAPFIASMQGKFQIEKLRKALIAKKAARLVHQGAEVWMPPKSEMAIAIVNSQLLVLGDRQSLRATLDAAYSPEIEGEDQPARLRAGELSAQYDLWISSEASLDGLKDSLGEQGNMLAGVDQFELGVSLRAGLEADVNLHMKSQEDLNKLGMILSGAKAMMAMSARDKKQPELASLAEKIKVGTSGDRLVASLKFTEAEIARGMADAMGKPKKPAAAVETASAAEPTAAAPAPAAPKPPAPLVVRIFNAEGGTRESQLR